MEAQSTPECQEGVPLSQVHKPNFPRRIKVWFDNLLTAASLSKVYPDQLDHVGLEQVDIPPGLLLHFGEGAGAQVEPGARAAVHRLLRDAAISHAALHRSLPRRHIQNCNDKKDKLRSETLKKVTF